VRMETNTPQGGMLVAGEENSNEGTMITVNETAGKTTVTLIAGSR
jgi:UDP-N-acetylmuramyl tripeptide synthase